MKRFRVLQMVFDARVKSLTTEIQEHWDAHVKDAHRLSRQQLEQALTSEFGEVSAAQKRQNFIDLGPLPLSVVAYDFPFFEQVRTAFVMGAYYPALTAACTLGERILNHLMLSLRDDFKGSPRYAQVRGKESFENWGFAINTLRDWDVLLPEVVREFRALHRLRTASIHYRPGIERGARALALAAIHRVSAIVGKQFGAFGPQPWFITGIPGEMYIKKDWEPNPFVRKMYLPNCLAVGPGHTVESIMPWRIRDRDDYEDRDITDDEFCMLRLAHHRS